MKSASHTVTTVLFDLDGTLLNSEQVNLKVVQRMCRTALGREPDEDEVNLYRTLSTDDLLARIAPDAPEELLGLWPRYFIEYQHLLELFPGIPDVLRRLKLQDVRIAVVTLQNRAEVRTTRSLVALDEWVDEWVAVDDAPRPKPDPAPLLEALHRLGSRPENAVMIGDSVTDLAAARRAGIRSGAALWGSFQPETLLQQNPDFVFSTPEEVLQLWQNGHPHH